MASLQRKKTGLYFLMWTDRNRKPKQAIESLKTTEQSRAKYLQRKLEIDYHEGKHDPWFRKWYECHVDEFSQSSLNDAIKQYLTERNAEKQWSNTTSKQNEKLLARFAEHVGENLPLYKTSASNLRSWYDRPGDRSQHTTLFERRIIRAFFRWAHLKGLIESFLDVNVKRPQENLPEYLTDDQLQQVYDLKTKQIGKTLKFSATGSTSWHIDAWKLAASIGLRKAEVAALRLDAIQNDTIIVGLGYRTKSAKQRAIPLLFEAPEVIQKYTDKKYRKADPLLNGSPLLFGRSGTGIDRMARHFSSCCRELWPDRKEFTFHSLRHTFAMRYLRAPAKEESSDYRLFKLQHILGHSDITTTQKYLKADGKYLQL